jgi:ribosomal protein L37AE/L43A
MTETPTSTVDCPTCSTSGDHPLDEAKWECPGCGEVVWTYAAPEATEALTANE